MTYDELLFSESRLSCPLVFEKWVFMLLKTVSAALLGKYVLDLPTRAAIRKHAA